MCAIIVYQLGAPVSGEVFCLLERLELIDELEVFHQIHTLR
jgi:hypothetical protein